MWWVCAEDWTHCCSGNTAQSPAPSGGSLRHPPADRSRPGAEQPCVRADAAAPTAVSDHRPRATLAHPRPGLAIPAHLFQDVAAELGEDFGDLAEEVVAVGASEGPQVLAVPASPPVVSGGGPVRKRRHLGGEPWVQEEREECRPWPLRLRTRCGVD